MLLAVLPLLILPTILFFIPSPPYTQYSLKLPHPYPLTYLPLPSISLPATSSPLHLLLSLNVQLDL